MADASFAQSSFLGGEWGKYAQGRFDRPDYRSALNVCRNAYPLETGCWARRPGTQYAQTTRGGVAGRLILFDLHRDVPIFVEFTTGFLRFFRGLTLITTNDDATVSSISAATPAEVATAAAHGWSTANAVQFANLGSSCPTLHNRVFQITKTGASAFTLVDQITGASIDGSTLGTLPAGATVQRVLEVASPYTGNLWSTVRLVQSEDSSAMLLHGSVPPQILTAIEPAANETYYSFTLARANFIDGPYLDPPTNGARLTPSATTGNITLTVSFAAWSTTSSYSIGDFVSFSSINYRSLTDQNQGNQPDTHPTNWEAVSAGLAIGPDGFVGTDVGRLMRIKKDDGFWVTGKITGLQSLIDRALAGSVNIGSLTLNGGLAAAFDGVTDQLGVDCAATQVGNTTPALSYIGKNYSAATPQKIGTATIWPASDRGLWTASKTYITTTTNYDCISAQGGWHLSSGPSDQPITTPTSPATVTINLRAKQTAPSTTADGTLLASGAFAGAPLTLKSNDQTTAWNYVWFEIVTADINTDVAIDVDTRTASPHFGDTAYTQTSVLSSYAIQHYVAEVQFFSPQGAATGNSVSFQILPVPNGVQSFADVIPRATWRLGVYSDTTGWPTCGTYHEGRLWLSGVVGNRIDGSMSNDALTFSPTDNKTTTAVLDSSGIAATFNAPDVNTIFWMLPDQLGLIAGTLAGNWLVQASNNNNPLTPTSIQAHRYNQMGCANIEPRRADHTVILVQRYRRKLFEYFADVFSGKFAAQNVTWAIKHMTKTGVAEVAYQQELSPIIWARCDDGSLFGITYKRDSNVSSQPPNFMAGHRHDLGSGRTVESIAVGPSSDGALDTLAMVTNGASGVRHVEMMANLFEEDDAVADAWLLDDAVAPSATVTGADAFTIYGLWHLNAQTVRVFAGGLDCGNWPVADGAVAVTYADGVNVGAGNGLFTRAFVNAYSGTMPVVVGFAYESDGQIVRPATAQESGARTGPALGKKRRSQQFAALLGNTGPISFGTSLDDLTAARFRTDGGTAYVAGRMFSGVYWDQLTDTYSFDGMLSWRADGPYPAFVAAVESFIQTQDK